MPFLRLSQSRSNTIFPTIFFPIFSKFFSLFSLSLSLARASHNTRHFHSPMTVTAFSTPPLPPRHSSKNCTRKIPLSPLPPSLLKSNSSSRNTSCPPTRKQLVSRHVRFLHPLAVNHKRRSHPRTSTKFNHDCSIPRPSESSFSLVLLAQGSETCRLDSRKGNDRN